MRSRMYQLLDEFDCSSSASIFSTKNQIDDLKHCPFAKRCEKEVLAEVDDWLSCPERKRARFEAHANDLGYPLHPSPEEDSPIAPSHNGQLNEI
ncbi:hypothetical protein RHMOL_Rhmol12G0073500 [Rhododendron molle]|uniref:Uncharacterized protein n=1 Tax=Rhododendron molle TaxID=49168 RepID=A0ACC0LF77_RHOML|nr:hypothetical protein RHMOL_Rhmol12G0073500 [Rhododendron molle]